MPSMPGNVDRDKAGKWDTVRDRLAAARKNLESKLEEDLKQDVAHPLPARRPENEGRFPWPVSPPGRVLLSVPLIRIEAARGESAAPSRQRGYLDHPDSGDDSRRCACVGDTHTEVGRLATNDPRLPKHSRNLRLDDRGLTTTPTLTQPLVTSTPATCATN